MHFNKDEKVFLKVSPIKGIMRYGKKGKLSLRYIWPFEILKKVWYMAYRLAIHPMFQEFIRILCLNA